MAQTKDVIEQLVDDHRLMDRLLGRLDDEDDPTELRRLFLKLGEILAGHEAIEQHVLFPALGAAGGHSHDQMDEHEEINQLLDEMRGLSAVGMGFRKRACAVVLELREHFAAEEEYVFPRVRALLSCDELEALGAQAIEARRRAASFPAVATT